MRENGLYTIIDNMEIEFVKVSKDSYLLRSLDPKSLEVGFKPHNSSIFIKPIDKNDLGPCYRLKNWALYRGHRSMFEWNNSDKSILFLTDDKEFAEGHEYDVVDRGRYALKLSVDDVEFVEERTPYELK